MLSNFLVRTLQCFYFLNFFVHENMKKLPSKVAHNRPKIFLSNAMSQLSYHALLKKLRSFQKYKYLKKKHFHALICCDTFARQIIEKQNVQCHIVDNLSKKYKAEKVHAIFLHSMIQYRQNYWSELPLCRPCGIFSNHVGKAYVMVRVVQRRVLEVTQPCIIGRRIQQCTDHPANGGCLL